MRELIKGVSRVYDVVLNVVTVVVCAIIVVSMFAAILQVISRYIGAPIHGITDFLQKMMLIMGLPGAPLLLRLNKHVSIDIFVSLFSKKTTTILDMVMSTVGAITCTLVMIGGVWVTNQLYTAGTMTVGTLIYPKFIEIMIIPFSMFFLTVEFLRKVYCDIAFLKTDKV
jgi:TRAP-type C4-dicarboxylate transport system permease small subunit